MTTTNPPCPCGSGAKYGVCCRAFHRGEEPGTPERLMRSRFAAFALGEVPYLWKTLHAEHPERRGTEAAFTASVRATRASVKYVRLRVLDRDLLEDGDTGRVLFHAELYEKGKERSFLELSLFRRENGAWRYHSGTGRPLSAKSPELAMLTISTAGFGNGDTTVIE